MEIPSARSDNEFYRYLDFAENQHLQALSNLCQNTDDMDLYTRLLEHKGSVDGLIKWRRHLFQSLDGSRSAINEVTGRPGPRHE